jgi:hypothetical protein
MAATLGSIEFRHQAEDVEIFSTFISCILDELASVRASSATAGAVGLRKYIQKRFAAGCREMRQRGHDNRGFAACLQAGPLWLIFSGKSRQSLGWIDHYNYYAVLRSGRA